MLFVNLLMSSVDVVNKFKIIPVLNRQIGKLQLLLALGIRNALALGN